MDSNSILQSERLILRQWKESDAEELYSLASDPMVGPSAGWPPHKSVEDSRSIIAEVLSEDDTFAVILKDSGKIIGSTGLFPPQTKNASILPGDREVGYWIGRGHWGNGYATETVDAMVRYAFSRPETSRVWCGAFHGNARSLRVQEKCGFTYSHTETVFVQPLGEEREEHFTILRKEKWMEKKEKN